MNGPTPQSTEPGGRQRRGKGHERRRRIFRSLHDCIVSKGYQKTTLADIAESADMTPSHLLYYFKGKEDILEQYFLNVSVRFMATLDGFTQLPRREQIGALTDFWFRGEASTMQEIGFMLECFGTAVHDPVLKGTKAEFDHHCKAYLRQIMEQAEQPMLTSSKDAAELAYSMMIGLRSAVYFDDDTTLDDAHRLFSQTMFTLCGDSPPQTG